MLLTGLGEDLHGAGDDGICLFVCVCLCERGACRNWTFSRVSERRCIDTSRLQPLRHLPFRWPVFEVWKLSMTWHQPELQGETRQWTYTRCVEAISISNHSENMYAKGV
jgi:hypothetical protein